MRKLSAVIITYNEEDNIEKCLESVKEVADEILVVDSFSTDNTEKICKEYDVKFIKREFVGYSDQKNFAVTQTENDMILSIDADEVLSERLKESIEIEMLEGEGDVYYISRMTNFCGKWIRHCGWYPDRKIRLYNRKLCKWDRSKVHEDVVFPKDVKKRKLKGDLLHYSFKTIEEHVDQINRFSEIKAKELFERRKKSNLLKIIYKPFFKFLYSYVFKLGFLDGFYGFVISKNSAFAYFLRYVKLRNFYLSDSEN